MMKLALVVCGLFGLAGCDRIAPSAASGGGAPRYVVTTNQQFPEDTVRIDNVTGKSWHLLNLPDHRVAWVLIEDTQAPKT